MTRQTIKYRAKEQLGNNIFSKIWLIAVLVCFIVSAIESLAGSVGIISIVIAGPMSYGLAYVFLMQARDNQPMEIGDIFKGFTNEFTHTFLISFMSGLFTLLWSLLFVIPGIVKYYSYSQAQYIKIDHPEYDWAKCIKESQRIMNGHKYNLFMLDISFIGWYIVGSLCLGIGALWVSAYHSAAKAHFYESIKYNTIEA